MVQLILLGTGTPMPDPDRCGSGVAVTTGAEWLLIDCGRGVTQRALQAGLDLCALRAVMLTHHHSDHVSDLATLAITRWVAGAPEPLIVVAPAGPCARFALRCLDPFEDEAFYSQARSTSPRRPAVAVRAFEAVETPEPVLRVDGWRVAAALVDHHPIEAAVGYRIEVDGCVVAISGDTTVCAGVEALAANADVLVHQAVRSDVVAPNVLEWNASARSVGELAHRLNLRHLVLTHLLPPPRTPADAQAFIDEVRSGGYTAELDLAHDLVVHDVPTLAGRSGATPTRPQADSLPSASPATGRRLE